MFFFLFMHFIDTYTQVTVLQKLPGTQNESSIYSQLDGLQQPIGPQTDIQYTVSGLELAQFVSFI